VQLLLEHVNNSEDNKESRQRQQLEGNVAKDFLQVIEFFSFDLSSG
jgi:hypothetical protein